MTGDMAGNLLDKVSPLVEFEVPDDLEEEQTSLCGCKVELVRNDEFLTEEDQILVYLEVERTARFPTEEHLVLEDLELEQTEMSPPEGHQLLEHLKPEQTERFPIEEHLVLDD